MPRGIVAAIVRWVVIVWVATLALAAILLIPSVLIVRHIADDVRGALARDDYSAAAASAANLQFPANACRVALLMPAAYSLQVVPGVSHWVHAANRVCDIGYDVGAVAKMPKVIEVAASMNGAAIDEVRFDSRFVRRAVDAAVEAEPYLHRALDNVRLLDELALPGDFGQRVHRVATTWPTQRVRELHSLLGVTNHLLGFDRPRTYFVALQSEAEMRALGGFLGQYAIVRIANGVPTVLEVGANTSLQTPTKPGVTLLPNTDVLTLTDNPMPVNSNLSPQGPDVGALWVYAWEQQSGQRLDGALAIDVETAAQLMAADGDALTKPDGTQLRDAKAIADYAQNGVYFDFDGPDQAGDPRKAYQLGVFRDLLQSAASSVFTFESMLRILPTAMTEGRVLIYFDEASIQEEIAATNAAKDLRQQPNLMYVTWNNWSGNKFDYYIEPKATARCVANGLELQVSVTASADPKGQYPPYIKQRLELPSETRPSVRDQFLLVMPRGSNVRWLTVDGRVARYDIVPFAGRPVAQLLLDTVAGETHTVRAGLGGIDRASIQVIGSAPHTIRC